MKLEYDYNRSIWILYPRLGNLLCYFVCCIAVAKSFSAQMTPVRRPLFPSQLETYDAVNGTRVELPCRIELKLAANEFTNVSWLKMPRRMLTRGALRVTQDHRIHLLPQSAHGSADFSLRIEPVQEKDAGEYRCLFQLGSTLHHKTVILVVKVPPYFEQTPPRLVTANEGANLRLFCNASGTPIPQLHWWVLLAPPSDMTHPPESLGPRFDLHLNAVAPNAPPVNEEWNVGSTSPRRRIVRPIEEALRRYKRDIFLRGGLLVFSRLHRQMSGWYFCEAANGISEPVISQSRLMVQYAPAIRMTHSKIQQYLGGNTILGCLVQACPVGKVQWELNGVPLVVPNCGHLDTGRVKLCQVEYKESSQSENILTKRTIDSALVQWPTDDVITRGVEPSLQSERVPFKDHLLDTRLSIANITHSDLGLYTCRMRTVAGVGEGHTRLEANPKIHPIHVLYPTVSERFVSPDQNLHDRNEGKSPLTGKDARKRWREVNQPNKAVQSARLSQGHSPRLQPISRQKIPKASHWTSAQNSALSCKKNDHIFSVITILISYLAI